VSSQTQVEYQSKSLELGANQNQAGKTMSIQARGIHRQMASPPKFEHPRSWHTRRNMASAINGHHPSSMKSPPRTMLKKVDQAYVKDTSREDTSALTARTYVASSERPQLRQNCWGNDQWVSPPAAITAKTNEHHRS